MNKRSFLTAAWSAILAAMPVTGALAQGSYPDKPIRVIMPWAAGGPADDVGRVVAVQMGEILGQPLVIETRAGASGTIGAAQVAKAPADGYTVLMNPSVQGIYPAQFKSLSFDLLVLDVMIESDAPVELKAYLVGGGKRVTETWLYQWRGQA